jgi:uncharacterized protein YndB with AHSA1/START domain
MALTAYTFDETWHIDAPVDEVWPVITDVLGYPAWWPQFVRVKRLDATSGPGARVRVRVKSALPYWMHFTLELAHEEPLRLSETRCSGDLNGFMRWTLTPEESGTRLHFREEVRTGKQLLNVLAPLLKPAFAWNHRIMMRQGERGLSRLLRERRMAAAAAPTPAHQLARI